jgi:hypothetical protein
VDRLSPFQLPTGLRKAETIIFNPDVDAAG